MRGLSRGPSRNEARADHKHPDQSWLCIDLDDAKKIEKASKLGLDIKKYKNDLEALVKNGDITRHFNTLMCRWVKMPVYRVPIMVAKENEWIYRYVRETAIEGEDLGGSEADVSKWGEMFGETY